MFIALHYYRFGSVRSRMSIPGTWRSFGAQLAINMLLLRSKEGNAGFSRASNSRILKNVPA